MYHAVAICFALFLDNYYEMLEGWCTSKIVLIERYIDIFYNKKDPKSLSLFIKIL